MKMCDGGIRDDDIDEKFVKDKIDAILGFAESLARQYHLQSTLDRVWAGGGPFYMTAHVRITWQELLNQLSVLRQAIEADLEKHLFVAVHPDKAKLVQQSDAWKPILQIVSGAAPDVEEALYCYALERNTAAVFHFMRAAEYGLRHLARKMRVTLTHRGHRQQIEFADWQKVITAIKNKITNALVTPPGPKRQAKLEMLSDAADHCLYMKDIWRNSISHARKPYKASEALSVLERVRDFMRFLVENFA